MTSGTPSGSGPFLPQLALSASPANDQSGHHGFVDRSGDLVLRPPFLHEGTDLRAFVFPAERQRLQGLCDRWINTPTGGQVRATPLGARAVLTFASIPRISSTCAGHRDLGYTDETDVAFWFPILLESGGQQRAAWLIPYIFVDNPYAVSIGREVYGFPKLQSQFEIPKQVDGDRYTVDTHLIRRHGRHSKAELSRLFELVKLPSRPTSLSSRLSSSAELFRLVFGGADSWKSSVPAQFRNALQGREVPVVFLRQLRDIRAPDRASYQEILLAKARIQSFKRGGQIPGDFELRVADAESHPLARDLGFGTAPVRARAACFAEFDFVMDAGERLWSMDGRSDASLRPAARKPGPPAAARPTRERIAVLGGGVASLSAVHALTSQPGWQERYEITVYQMGHRLGGKGASGRNGEAFDRIEEHGLHVWLGFYENAFRLIRGVYDELGRGPEHPMADWQQAFKPHSHVVLKEDSAGEPWTIRFPRNSQTPGDGSPLTAAQIARTLLGLIHDQMRAGGARGPSAGRRSMYVALARALRLVASALLRISQALGRGSVEDQGGASWKKLGDELNQVRDCLRSAVASWIESDEVARRMWLTADLVLTSCLGILRDRLLVVGFDAVDHEDLSEWLTRHGASPATVASAPVRAIYEIAMAYREGDSQRPDFAAGTAVRGMLKFLFGYKGAIMWHLQAGMGDVVFAPLYEVLQRRGVRFEFFHRVDNLGLAPDQVTLETIAMTRQAKVWTGDYQPLVDVKGLPCWPSQPRYQQLVDGERLAQERVDFESPFAQTPGARPVTLRRGQDFDRVILGIPVPAIPAIASELIAAKPAWRAMVAKVETTSTFSAQLWLRPDLAQLGWRAADRSDDPPVVGASQGFVATWADMSHLRDRESWPAGARPGHTAYLCGPWPEQSLRDHGADTATQRVLVRKAVERFLDTEAGSLWPRAVSAGGFDRSLFNEPGGATDSGRYFRANTEGSERYIQSVKGSTAFRLRTDESGVNNLWLVGDWIRTGFDCGCVEAAVLSGLQCAEKLAARRLPVAAPTEARAQVASAA